MPEPGARVRGEVAVVTDAVPPAGDAAEMVDPEEVVREDAARRMALARQWVSSFPVNPHPDLGRTGPVCPYMGRAHELRRVELISFDARTGEPALIAHARQLRSEVERRGAIDRTDHMYLVFFLVPYGLPESELRAMTQRVHAQLRPEFVQRGQLAGDFWPYHAARGLHSPSFRPFESPLPLFAVRNMIPGDLPFFATPDTPPAERLTYLGYYREHFRDTLPAHWRRRWEEAESAARSALDDVDRR